VISEKASKKYAGTHLRETVTLEPNLLQFEHTNGLNLVSLDIEYLQPVWNIYKHKFWLKWNFGLGGVWVITKTDVKILNDGIDNEFHLSGYSLAAKTGPRLEFWHWGFLAAEVKGGYMTLPSVLIQNNEPKRANHNFSFVQVSVVAGLQIPINRIHEKLKRKKI